MRSAEVSTYCESLEVLSSISGRSRGQVSDGQDHDESEAQDEHGERHGGVEVSLELSEDGQWDGLGHAPEAAGKDDRRAELSERPRPGRERPCDESG